MKRTRLFLVVMVLALLAQGCVNKESVLKSYAGDGACQHS